MPVLIALTAIVAFAVYYFYRVQRAGQIASDMARDVAAAARRIGFRRQARQHPAESIDDPRLAMIAIAHAFIELDDYPTQEDRRTLLLQAQSKLDLSQAEAEERIVVGRWLVEACGGPAPAISRLSRKLYRLEGHQARDSLLPLLDAVASRTGDGTLTERQDEAFHEIGTTLRKR